MELDINELKKRANNFEGLTLTKREGQEFLALCKSKVNQVCCSTKKQLIAANRALEGEIKNPDNKEYVKIPPAYYPTMLNVASIGRNKK